MSLTPRKRKSKHTHTTSEVKEAAKYETERPPHKPVPAAEVILYSDEETTSTLKDWQSSSDATKIDTDKFDVPPQDVTSEDSGYFVDENLTPPTISATAKETDTATTFKTWIEVTITREDNMSGYVVSYREFGETEWHHIHVEQPESGNPTVSTPELKENTDYEVHACKITATGKASPWCTTQTVTTETNDTAPNAPTLSTPAAILNGVILEWSGGNASDFDHYEVYYGTSSPPSIPAGTTTRSCFVWLKKQTEAYTDYYFAVKSVDTSGNASDLSNVETAKPLQAKPIDLKIEVRPWTADFKMWEDDNVYQKLYWAASDGTSNATVKFADGTTKTITANTTGTTFTANTLYYFYWQDGQSTLQYTTDYSQAVGEGKGLMAVVMVGNNSSDPKERSTILTFNSYSPTIGAGAIAAGAILAQHIQAGQINTNHITSDASLAIKASQIVLDGTTYFVNAWQKSGDLTKIDGGKISAGTVDADQIATNAIRAHHVKAGEITAEKLEVSAIGARNEIENPSYEHGNWNAETGADQGSVTTAEAKHGTHSYCLSASGSNVGGRYSNYINVKGWDYLTIGVWIKATVTTGSLYGQIYFYDGNKNSLSPDHWNFCTVSSSTSNWEQKTKQYDVSTFPSGTVYVRVRFIWYNDNGNPSGTAYIDAWQLVSGQYLPAFTEGVLSTDAVRFYGRDSDPEYDDGKLWWRSDKDQLRFSSGTTINDVAIIPKYPLYGVQVPPENMLINQSFEIDRDDDGIPDFWENISSGSGSISLTTSDSNKGGKCLKLLHGAGLDNPAKTRSTLIPVKPSQKYFFSVDAKRVSGDSPLYAYIYWYERDGSTQAGSFSLPTTISSSWTTYSGQTTSPSNAYFARIILVAQSTSSSGEVRYDNVILSELRAAEPTAGVVAATAGNILDAGTISNDTWTKLTDFTVSSTEHEMYVVFIQIQLKEEVNPDWSFQARVKVRVGTSGTDWYPRSEGMPFWFRGGKFDSIYATVTIPKDVSGETIEIWFWQASGYDKAFTVAYTGWGHSYHYHR